MNLENGSYPPAGAIEMGLFEKFLRDGVEPRHDTADPADARKIAECQAVNLARDLRQLPFDPAIAEQLHKRWPGAGEAYSRARL